MLTAKDELAHVVASMSEDEAERLLDLIGEGHEDADQRQTAAELLKIAARLLYKAGSPEFVQAGEQVDAILAALIPLIKAK